jgi:hypothetical protein
MPPDFWSWFWSSWDTGPLVLGDDERREAKPPLWSALLAAQILVPTSQATEVICESCLDPHPAAVFSLPGPRGLRWFHECPEGGSYHVREERLRRWQVQATALGLILAGREAEEVASGWLWKLGAISVGAQTKLGWLVRGWWGQTDLAEKHPELLRSNALVFVGKKLPPLSVWGKLAPANVIPLGDMLTFTDSGLSLNRESLATFVPDEPVVKKAAKPLMALPPGTTWEQVSIHVAATSLVVRTGTLELTLGLAECGFADGRKGSDTPQPTQLWSLLQILSRRKVLSTSDHIDTKSENLRQKVKELRKLLQRMTGLKDDPFESGKGKDYSPRLTITGVSVILDVPPGLAWEQITIHETLHDEIRVSFEAKDITPVGLEAALNSAEYTRCIPICDLVFPAALQGLLRRILRGEHVLEDRTHTDLADLGQRLNQFLPAEGEALFWRAGSWRPTFEVRSDCE